MGLVSGASGLVSAMSALLYAALRYSSTRPEAASVCGLKLLVYAALSY